MTTIQYGSGFVYKEGCDAEMMFYLCPANKPGLERHLAPIFRWI